MRIQNERPIENKRVNECTTLYYTSFVVVWSMVITLGYFDYYGQDQVRDYCRTLQLKSYLIQEDWKSHKDDCTAISSCI